MNSILVTAIGSFASSEVIKNLKQSNNRVVGCDIYDRRWLANANKVDVFYQVPLANKQEEYINRILDICRQENVKYIIPLIDVEVDVFNSHRIRFNEKNIIVCISSYESISVCRDKYKAYKFLKDKGVSCLIHTQLLKDVDTKNINYPVVIKPFNGRSSNRLHFVDSEEQLLCLLNSETAEEFVLQEQIEGSVVTVDVCRNPQNNSIVCIPRLELLRTLNGAGTSVQILDDKELISVSKEIATDLNICGTVNFEFLKFEDNYYFLECNPRFSGGVAFSGLAGYDFVNNSLKCFQGKDIDPPIKLYNKYICKEYIEVVTG